MFSWLISDGDHLPVQRENSSHLHRTRFNQAQMSINPFKPEFTIVIFIHYKSRIAAAILDL